MPVHAPRRLAGVLAGLVMAAGGCGGAPTPEGAAPSPAASAPAGALRKADKVPASTLLEPGATPSP